MGKDAHTRTRDAVLHTEQRTDSGWIDGTYPTAYRHDGKVSKARGKATDKVNIQSE